MGRERYKRVTIKTSSAQAVHLSPKQFEWNTSIGREQYISVTNRKTGSQVIGIVRKLQFTSIGSQAVRLDSEQPT